VNNRNHRIFRALRGEKVYNLYKDSAMHQKFNETINQVLAWAQADRNIQGVIIIGSQARSTLISDQWSDLDLLVLANDPKGLVTENTWFNRFGNVVCFFDEIVPLHFTNWNWCVKRVLYADNRDVDFSILPYHHLDEVLSVNKDIILKGYRVIYDSGAGQLETKVCALLQTVEKEAAHPPTQQELDAIVRDLLFHVIWAFKKIKRKELWVAVNCINCYMKNLLLRLIEAHNVSTHQRPDTLMYSGRFLEQRTDQEILAKLEYCFTRYDPVDAVETLQHLIDFINTTAKAICERNGYEFDATQFERIQKMYDEMKLDTK